MKMYHVLKNAHINSVYLFYLRLNWTFPNNPRHFFPERLEWMLQYVAVCSNVLKEFETNVLKTLNKTFIKRFSKAF